MASGQETLASIDQAVGQVRRDLADLDRQVQGAADELRRLGQEESDRLRELAELRLDQLARGEMLAGMDDADRRVVELLAARETALVDLQAAIESSDRRQSELETDRAAQQERVHQAAAELDHGVAATQRRLASVPEYQTQLAAAQKSDGVARHAETKAQQAEADRIEKGKNFEADPLFMYLWQRGYGTSQYRAGPLTRYLDGWVARLCRYPGARPNYAMLLEIPRRLREHADRTRAAAEQDREALQTLEHEAEAADGVLSLREALQNQEEQLQAIDAELAEEEARYSQYITARSEFAGGEDEYSQQSREVLVAQFRREPLAQLRREAEATVTAEDNVLVGELADLAHEKRQLDAQLAEIKSLHLRHLKRLEDLEHVRRNFKNHRYDDAHSTFANGALIGAILNEFLRGMASSGQLWNTIEQQHRRRRIQADPDFGSGGLGRPTMSFPSLPIPSSRGSGGGFTMGGGRSSGGFRTGGGF
jgi:chromosome segregation ATPase